MVAVGHTAVGTIIGVTTYNFLNQGDLASGLIATGILGVVSHYITDFIPHGHFVKPDKLKKYLTPIIIFDVLLPIFLILEVIFLKEGFSPKFFYIMFGIGGVQLPDVLDGLIYTKLIKPDWLLKVENNFHQSLHWHGTGSKTLLLGIRDLWQMLIIVYTLYLIAVR